MRAFLFSTLVTSLVTLCACSKGEGAPPTPMATSNAAPHASAAPATPPAAAPAAPAAAPTPPPVPPRTGTKIDDVMDGYEAVRVKLAGDDFAGAKSAAEKLVAAATAALEPGVATDAHVKGIQEGAQKIVQAPDMPAARMAFGEVSKATVALVVAKPELQTGRFLMMCPMAKGYQKWVQTDQALRNPYFGSEMLECGEKLAAWGV